MRIAVIVDTFPSLSQSFVLNQITGLIDRGHEIDIYGKMPTPQPKIHSDVERYNLYVHTHHWNVPWKIKSVRALYDTMSFLLHRQYDIIHCHLGPNAVTSMRLQRMGILKGRLITTFHGYDMSSYLEKSGRHVYNRLFDKGNLFLPVSSHMKRQLINLGCDEKKIIIHRMGVDTKRFSLRSCGFRGDGIFRVTSIARLIEKKGIEYGIRAVSRLVKLNKKVEYSIVGDGPLREGLQRLAHELGIGSAVNFFGWKMHEEVLEILKESDILLAPSVTGKDGDQEGIPVTIMEAMAIGLPVLATEHSGIPELIKDGVSGFLVHERDVDSLAEKLDYLAGHPEVRPGMGRAGRTFVEKYHDIDKLNDGLVEIYKGLLKE